MIVDFFTSEMFGFLLKLFSGLAAAAFGMLGIGTKTREDDGRLTRNGKIALAGIIVAGLLGVGTSVYDFAAGQKKARDAAKESQLLMLSVQRGLYPLREMKLTVRVSMSEDFPGAREYEKWLRARIRRNSDCKVQSSPLKCTFQSVGPNRSTYSIPTSSGLFPSTKTQLRSSFNAFDIYVRLYAYQRTDTLDKPTYQPSGRPFRISWSDELPARTTLKYNLPEQTLNLDFDEIGLVGNAAKTGGVYSLADIAPGMIAMTLGARRYVFCGVPLAGDCRERVAPLFKAISLEVADLTFPFPQHIVIGAPRSNSIDCFIFDREFKAALLPGVMDVKPGFVFQRLNLQNEEKAQACKSVNNSIKEASRTDVPLDDDFGFLKSRSF